jgi:hypothetical protein
MGQSTDGILIFGVDPCFGKSMDWVGQKMPHAACQFVGMIESLAQCPNM